MEASPSFADRVFDRTPPFSLEAETSVLGGMLIDREAVTRAVEHIEEGMFYREANRRLYRAMVRLFERGDVIDVITVAEELKKTGELESAGGFDYLGSLVDAVPTAANIEYHARIVRDKALLRRLVEQSSQIIRDVYDQGERDVEEILDQAEARIFQVAESHRREGFVWIKEILWSAFEHIERLQESDGGITGVPTGFPDLDRMTTGLQKGDLVIVAARPSMGKTSLAMNMAANAAIAHGISVAIFSLEMSSEQLVQRLLCSEGRIDAMKLRRGRLSQEEHQRLAAAAGHLNTAPIWIDDQPGANVLEIRAKARRLQSEIRSDGKELGIVLIDYMQLMSGTQNVESRVQEVSQISRGLKALARELEVPVIALSQLSRGPEQRTDKRPMLSDLRESGCLTGDTLVELADSGRRAPIRDLAGSAGFAVWALNEETEELEPARVSRAFSTGTKPVFRLRTRLGREIRATANHKFLTVAGWKRLDELGVGEHLALPRRLPTPTEQTLTDSELALLGHLIGDGCTLPKHAIQYTTREPDLAKLVAELASACFGEDVQPRIHPERDWLQVYLKSTRRHARGVRSAVSEWLDRLGVWGLRSHEKRVPVAVFAQPREAVARFLRHLWATDGCVRLGESRKPYPAVYYATSSRALACDVQDLLLRVGITATLREVPQGGKGRAQHQVWVSGRRDLTAFCRDVGAVGRYKSRDLDRIASFLEGRAESTNRDVIPSAIWDRLVRPVMAAQGMTHRELHRELGMAYGGAAIFRQNVSRERAARVASVVRSAELERLASSDVYWDAIVSIEPDGAEDVFDLTVPGPHNFVANGLIAHNSIEQDADVVMFLYRPEYYAPAEKREELEGKSELIIGKQRNGPTGVVDLYFQKAYTRFDSMAQGPGGAARSQEAPPGFRQ